MSSRLLKRGAIICISILIVVLIIFCSNKFYHTPRSAYGVTKYIERKGGENITALDFSYLPHRLRLWINCPTFEYDLTNGDKLVITYAAATGCLAIRLETNNGTIIEDLYIKEIDDALNP